MYLSIATLVLAVSSVSAFVPRNAFNAPGLLPRQNTCTNACAPFQSAASSCTTVACLCTVTIAAELQSCVNCAIDAAPTDATVISAAAALVSTFQDTCSGISLPIVTVGGSTGASSTSPLPVIPVTSTSSRAVVPTTSSLVIPGTTSISQTVIRPSSTATPASTSAASTTTKPSSPFSSGHALCGSKSVVVAIGVALGVALVY